MDRDPQHEPLNDLSGFPAWWRRLFPEIEWLADNGLYAAFEVRREQLDARSRRRRRILTFAWVLCAASAPFISSIYKDLGVALDVAFWSLILGAIGAALINVRIERPTSMPSTYRKVVSPAGIRTQFYLDLWMTPVSGRDVLTELMSRAYRSRGGAYLFATLMLGVLAGLFVLVLRGIAIPFLLGLYCVPIAVLLYPMLVRGAAEGQVEFFRQGFLNQLAVAAKQRSQLFRSTFLDGLKKLAIGILFFIAIIPTVLIAIFLIDALLSALTPRSPIIDLLESIPMTAWQVMAVVAAVIANIAISFALWRSHRNGYETLRLSIDRYAAWMDRAQAMMARTLAGDTITDQEFKVEILDTWLALDREYKRARKARRRERNILRRFFAARRSSPQ
ncbi:hypothetical protein KQI84_08310 [bacterium]|nr:hypothetical protein [bacterium]